MDYTWLCICLVTLLQRNFVSSLEISFKLSGSDGIVETPNYPLSYPLNVTCIWTISNSGAKSIKLKFLDFHLEKAKRCIYDYVQVRDDKSLPWSSVSRHCGSTAPPVIKSRGSLLQLKFFSDGLDIVERGFRAKWEIEAKNPASSKCSNDQQAGKSAQKTKCANQPRKTLVFKQICPSPYPQHQSKSRCRCNPYEQMDSSGSPYWIEKLQLRKANNIKLPGLTFSYLNLTNSSFPELPQEIDMTQGAKILKRPKYDDRATKILIPTFSGVLVIFIAIFLVLLLLIFRKNREIYKLRESSPRRPFTFEWTSHPITASLQSRARSEQGYIKVPTGPKSSPCGRPSPCSFYGITDMQTCSSPQTSADRCVKMVREDWNGKRITSHIVRTRSDMRKSFSSNEDDLSGDDTSDVYVSSGFPSPINASKPCRCYKKYNV